MKQTHIGNIDQGIDGVDAYYLIEVEPSDDIDHLDPDNLLRAVQDKFLHMHYRTCAGPGQAFCCTVLVSPVQYSEDRFIGIAQTQYDI